MSIPITSRAAYQSAMIVMVLGSATLIPGNCLGQDNILNDERDGKQYRIKEINGRVWMIDNLDFSAPGSFGLTDEDKSKYKQFNLHGRYYHLTGIDSVCPSGWRLPNVADWNTYFDFLAGLYPDVKIEKLTLDKPSHLSSFLNYEGKIDLFEKDNALNLNPTGRYEGGVFNAPNVYADYYTKDDKESVPGKSHIHIMNAYTTVHSHKHNMQPRKEGELRRFMVRCVK